MDANNQRKKEYHVGVNKALWYGLKNRTYVKDHDSLANKTYTNKNALEAESLVDKILNKTFKGIFSEKTQIAEKKSPEKNSVKAENLANAVQNHFYVKSSEAENYAGKILENRTFTGLFSEEAKCNEIPEPEKVETAVEIAKEANNIEKAIDNYEKKTIQVPAEDYEKEPIQIPAEEKQYEKPAEEKPCEKPVDKTPVQDAKEYLTLEDLAKIPGAKSVASLNNKILNLFKEDNPTSYTVKREGKVQKSIYQASVKLFEYILKDPSKAKETAKNWKEYLKQTEVKAFGELINKIVDCDEAVISIDEMCKLPGTKSYKSIVQVLLDYARLNPDKKTIELKPASEPGSKPTYENKYKLTEKLVDLIFVNKKIAEDVKDLLKEKNKPTIAPKKEEPLDEIVEEDFADTTEEIIAPEEVIAPKQAIETQPEPAEQYTQPLATPVDTQPKKSKGQLRREKEEAEKEEIRRFLVKKSGITGGNVRKTGGSRTDLGNLYKGLPDHKKALAKEVIAEWIREGIIEVIRSNYVSFNPRNLDKIRPYAED